MRPRLTALGIRLLVSILLGLHGWWVYASVGADDFLPIRIAYALTVVFHGIHTVQYYLWLKRYDVFTRRKNQQKNTPA
jgi:hypothetical protein